MIVLTGDVHHRSLGTRDQRHLRGTEIDAALRYARLSAAAGVPCTLFLTGRCTLEHPREVAALARVGIEIGGHTWDAFGPALPRRILKKLAAPSLHGPASLQRYHVRKTLDHLETRTGSRPTSWRNHAYHADGNTVRILAEHGVQSVSDEVSTRPWPLRTAEGPWSFPINVLPDHEHLFHAHRDAAFVERWVARKRFRDAFGSASHDIADYERLVHAQLDRVLSDGGVATLLLHPACMELADGMAFFQRLLARLENERCETISGARRLLEHDVMEASA